MAMHEAARPSQALTPGGDGRAIELICFAFAVAYFVFLGASLFNGLWLIGAQNRPIPMDFVSFWAAGRLALDGNPAGGYDLTLHRAVELQAVDYASDAYFTWYYPPTFLFVAVPLALIPYVPSFFLWVAITLPVYVATVRAIIGRRIGVLLACAFPGVLWNATVGQNGFLTTALIGGTLGLMQRRPVLAGCCLGLLTYKPQFGFLFPLVLAVAGRWRVFGAAAVVGSTLALLSWFAFGAATWEAFFHSVPAATKAALSDGRFDWAKLQSLFGFARTLGAGETVAWTLQGLVIAASVIALSLIWRRPIAFDLQAAALATGVLIVTPYLYIYDLAALAIPMAFLIRLGLASGFLPGEKFALAVASLLVLIFPLTPVPTGLLSVLIVAAVITRRILSANGEAPRGFPAKRPSILASADL